MSDERPRNSDGEPLETERKFLIRYPDIPLLTATYGCRKLDMVQTYLTADGQGVSMRLRATTENGVTVYHSNVKRRVSDMTHIEHEERITKRQYERLLKNADPALRTIEKTRYAVAYRGRVFEIDVYPFWNDRAIAEVELESETAVIEYPPFIEIIREVTSDGRYRNRALAAQTVVEDI